MSQNSAVERIKAVAKRIKKNCRQELKLAHAHTGIAYALGFRDWHHLHISLVDGISPAIRRQFMNLDIRRGSEGLYLAAQRFGKVDSNLDIKELSALFEEFLLPVLERWCANRDRQQPESEQLIANNTHRHRPAKYPTDVPFAAVSVGGSVVLLAHGQNPTNVIYKRRRYVASEAARNCTFLAETA
jgi:hypothetical protein